MFSPKITTTCLIGVVVGSASCGDAANAGLAPWANNVIDRQRADAALLTFRCMELSYSDEIEMKRLWSERQKRPSAGPGVIGSPRDIRMFLA
jgi:hypothetical protein